MGLYPRKGALAVGSDADIVLLDPARRGCIRKEELHETDYTPWEGHEVSAWPIDDDPARQDRRRGRKLLGRSAATGSSCRARSRIRFAAGRRFDRPRAEAFRRGIMHGRRARSCRLRRHDNCARKALAGKRRLWRPLWPSLPGELTPRRARPICQVSPCALLAVFLSAFLRGFHVRRLSPAAVRLRQRPLHQKPPAAGRSDQRAGARA